MNMRSGHAASENPAINDAPRDVEDAVDLRRRVRWHAKKLARHGVAWPSIVARRLTDRGRRNGETVHVLTYHRFGDDPYDPFCVRVEDFECQMRLLAESGRAISLAALLEFLDGGRTIPAGAALVTIDDGCPSSFHAAMPILRRFDLPAVVFVPAGEILPDDRSPEPRRRERPIDRITVGQLLEMQREGITIGSHAWTHHSLGSMSDADARIQLARSKGELERLTGQPVLSFAYPFGTRADFDERTARLAREAGYRCAFTSQHGAVRLGSDPYELPRVKIEGGEGLSMFEGIANGALDAWRWVDRALWRLQHNRQ